MLVYQFLRSLMFERDRNKMSIIHRVTELSKIVESGVLKRFSGPLEEHADLKNKYECFSQTSHVSCRNKGNRLWFLPRARIRSEICRRPREAGAVFITSIAEILRNWRTAAPLWCALPRNKCGRWHRQFANA